MNTLLGYKWVSARTWIIPVQPFTVQSEPGSWPCDASWHAHIFRVAMDDASCRWLALGTADTNA